MIGRDRRWPDWCVRIVSAAALAGSAWTATLGIAALPPVDRLAVPLHLFERAGDEAGAAAMGSVAAELPKLAGGALIAVDQFVQLEGIKLAGVVSFKTFPHPLKQVGESGFVIADDERFIGLTLRFRGLCGIGAHADGIISSR